MGKAIFLDSLDFSANHLGKVTRMRTLFAIDKEFVGANEDIIDTRLCLFGEGLPNWTMVIDCSPSNLTKYVTAVDCMVGAHPWPGITLSNAGYPEQDEEIGLSMNFTDYNPVKTWGSDTTFKCWLKREGDVVSYSLDGVTYTPATFRLGEIVASIPALATRSLIVGGGIIKGEDIGRPFIGSLSVKVFTVA